MREGGDLEAVARGVEKAGPEAPAPDPNQVAIFKFRSLHNSVVSRNDLDFGDGSNDSHNVWLSRKTLSIVTKPKYTQSQPFSNTER